MAIVLRSVKGSNLTAAEVDGNFTTLETMVTAKAAQGVGVADAALVGNNVLQFQLTDHSYLDPLTLPTATFNARGVWTPSTSYLVNDTVSYGGAGYIVAVQHTSASTFDPHATDGSGHELYKLFLQAAQPPPVVNRTASCTLAITDANTYQRVTSSSTVTMTIPSFALVPFPVGTEINLRQAGVGAIMIVGTTGVTINDQDGCLNLTSGDGATATAKNVATDVWDILGRLQSSASP